MVKLSPSPPQKATFASIPQHAHGAAISNNQNNQSTDMSEEEQLRLALAARFVAGSCVCCIDDAHPTGSLETAARPPTVNCVGTATDQVRSAVRC
jgi:hypothetical protein